MGKGVGAGREPELAAGGAHRERTSRHHRDTARAVNDGVSAFGAIVLQKSKIEQP